MDTNERFATVCGVAANRWRDAVAIQGGACNPSGVARALVRAINACLTEDMDTNAICNDAAVRLIVHQLAHLCGTDAINTGFETYTLLVQECESKAIVPQGWDKV